MEQEQTTSAPKRTLDASVSFIMGAVLLVIAVSIGGFYLWNKDAMSGASANPTQNANMQPVTQEDPATTEAETVAATAALSVQGTSDELSAIEADLNATDLSSLEDIDQI